MVQLFVTDDDKRIAHGGYESEIYEIAAVAFDEQPASGIRADHIFRFFQRSVHGKFPVLGMKHYGMFPDLDIFQTG